MQSSDERVGVLDELEVGETDERVIVTGGKHCRSFQRNAPGARRLRLRRTGASAA